MGGLECGASRAEGVSGEVGDGGDGLAWVGCCGSDGGGGGGAGYLVPGQRHEFGLKGGFSGDPVHFRRFSGKLGDCGESLEVQRISWSR